MPQDHLLRSIDPCDDMSGIRAHLTDHYSHAGRPSIDPELLIGMLLVGYCFGIRFERRLCEVVHLDLAYRWFGRLDLTDAIPDHSTFSKNRLGRFRTSDLLRHVFEATVARCMEEGLADGHGFVRQCTASEYNPTAQRRRKTVEMRFAHLKRILGLSRLRLQSPCGVQDEFGLAATAQNLRKLAKRKPMVPATGSRQDRAPIIQQNQRNPFCHL